MTDLVQTARDYLAHMRTLDLEAAFALMEEDACVVSAVGDSLSQAVMKQMFAMVRPRFAQGMNFDVTSATAQNDRVVIEATANAPLTAGGTYVNSYVFVFEFRNGKISAVREYCDTMKAAQVFAP